MSPPSQGPFAQKPQNNPYPLGYVPQHEWNHKPLREKKALRIKGLVPESEYRSTQQKIADEGKRKIAR